MHEVDFSLPIADPTWVFFIVLCIILFAPLLLNRLRIPHIIGMILAGVIVGEHGLHLLEYDTSFKLFGKVGLYYIMFLAGLEMNMEDFKQTRNKAFMLGLLAFVVPLILGFISNRFLLEYGFVTSILLASMYASHTLIAYPIVIRYGLSRHRSVSIAVGGTAVTDTFTLLTLAIVSGFYKGEMGQMFWLMLILKIVALGGFIMYTFPKIARWFFAKYTDGILQFVFVLSLVFLGAALMELIGMEGILGAFLVGLVLNRLIPHVSPLMHHVEFIGNALFIPYFLIGVGMIINLRVLFSGGDALKVALVMTTMALTSKWIASWMTQKIYKMKAVEREMMFGLSNAQAAATLAAVLVGYNIILPNGERLLNEDVLNGVILLILLTCIVSSFTTERAAKRLAIEESKSSSEKDAPQACSISNNVLVVLEKEENINCLMNLSLIVRNSDKVDNLMAINVVDSKSNRHDKLLGDKKLERAASVVSSTNLPLKTINRYDFNLASGVIHTVKEYGVTDIIISAQQKTKFGNLIFGYWIDKFLKDYYQQLLITNLLSPLNVVSNIKVVMPSKAQYESGFSKWVNMVMQMGSMLDAKVHFYSDDEGQASVKTLLKSRNSGATPQLNHYENWDQLLTIINEINSKDLLIVVTSRRGYISYNTATERLINNINYYLLDKNFIILYPGQCGDAKGLISFSAPLGDNE